MQQLLGRADGISLREVLPKGRFLGADKIRVHGCCSDYRSCRPGDVYVAVVGADEDGHDHVDEALQRGAVAVVTERLVPGNVASCIVPDTREAYGLLCQHLAGLPHRQLELIGVTGTFGKTITALLLASVLEAAQRQAGVLCSLGYSDSDVTSPAEGATPQPAQLASWLSRMVANGCSHAVLEASSEALVSRHLAGVELDAAILTNVHREHLDLHGSLKNYRRAKQRLFERLKPGGFAIVNADDPESRFVLPEINGPVITVGMHEGAQLQAQLVDRCPSEQTFLLMAGQETVPVRTLSVGDSFIYNCLSAAAVGLVMGLDLTAIVRGLESLERIPGRLERIECGQAFSVFVDQAQTPVTLAAALHALRQVTAGRLLCVYGATTWQDGQQRAALGHVAERGADVGVITSNNPGHEAPLQIAHDILDGFKDPGRAHIIPDRAKAIQWALGEARPGDTVLIAGKGDQLYQTIGQRPMRFDDREVARRWLRAHAPNWKAHRARSRCRFAWAANGTSRQHTNHA